MLFRMRPKFILSLILLLVSLASCTAAGAFYISSPLPLEPTTAKTLTVYSAASLTEAFNEVSTNFENTHPGAKVILNFAGSQQLAQQLSLGAPADIFASANLKQMQIAQQSGRIAAGQVRVFAHNNLVVITPLDNPAQIIHLQDLARPGLKIGLAASAAPVGRYSLEFLDKASYQADFWPDFKSDVLNNVVSYEETVRAVLSKVILGEVDAGIVYSSDLNAKSGSQVLTFNIPEALNPVASYYIAPINESSQANLANEYVNFVLSPSGQLILEKHGFQPVR